MARSDREDVARKNAAAARMQAVALENRRRIARRETARAGALLVLCVGLMIAGAVFGYLYGAAN